MTELTLHATALELRARAERCLASEAPTAAEAHTLAAAALEFLRANDGPPSADGTPYRDASTAPSPGDMAATVALEQALEACQERLRIALAELDALRARAVPILHGDRST